jgi:membrane protease subunit HflC
MSNKIPLIVVISFILLMILSKSIYITEETHKSLILRFGKVLRDINKEPKVYLPGLNLKIPFFDSVVMIDARVQLMDGRPDVFTTQNKEFLDVDTYVQWRVTDFAKFYIRTSGNFMRAESFIEGFVDNGLRNQFGKRTLEQAVSGEREALMGDIRTFVNKKLPEYGLKVVDIRVKKVNYTSRVLENVYEQIISERRAQAILIRSDGKQTGNIIKAKTDASVLRTLAKADEYDRVTRGNADAMAAKIYADTYNQDPEFYTFLRSLEAYRKSFSSKNDILVLNPDNDFFKYLKSSHGKSHSVKE